MVWKYVLMVCCWKCTAKKLQDVEVHTVLKGSLYVCVHLQKVICRVSVICTVCIYAFSIFSALMSMTVHFSLIVLSLTMWLVRDGAFTKQGQLTCQIPDRNHNKICYSFWLQGKHVILGNVTFPCLEIKVVDCKGHYAFRWVARMNVWYDRWH